MSIQDHHMNQNINTGKDPLDFSLPVNPGVSQTNFVFGRGSPGFAFQVVKVGLYGSSFTNLTSVDVGIAPTAGGTFTSCLSAPMTPINDTEVFGTLSATKALTYTRNTTSQIIVRYTSGTGPSTANAYVYVTIRPRPYDGEVL